MTEGVSTAPVATTFWLSSYEKHAMTGQVSEAGVHGIRGARHPVRRRTTDSVRANRLAALSDLPPQQARTLVALACEFGGRETLLDAVERLD